jgi:hypothetical protein
VISRSFEILLVVALIVGGLLVSQSIFKKADLTREHDRLMQKTGQLTVGDPTRVHLRALETGEPMSYAWRAYFPPNYSFGYTCSSGSGGMGSHSDAWEGILRVRFREIDGNLQLYYRFAGGSGLRSFGSSGFRELRKANPDLPKQLVVEQLAKDGPVDFATDEMQTLIKIKLPEELLPEAKKKLGDWEYKRLEKNLEWIRVGPYDKLQREARARGE